MRLHAWIEARQPMHNAMVNGAFSDADKPLPRSDAGIGAHIGAARQGVQIIQ